MKSIYWGLAFLVFLSTAHSAVFDVCDMTEDEVKNHPVWPSTVIHFPFKWDMTCEEFVGLDERIRASSTLCPYQKIEMRTKTKDGAGWWNDARWDHVLSKCRKFISADEEKQTKRIPDVLNVCDMKQEDVEKTTIGPGTIILFDKIELSCGEIRQMKFPTRQNTMVCYYHKPEEVGPFSSGWGRWYDLRGTLIYSKCMSLQ